MVTSKILFKAIYFCDMFNYNMSFGFRFVSLAQTLLNLAFARFEGQFFGLYFREFEKKQKQEWIRFAHKAFLLASLGLDINFLQVIYCF